MGSIPQPIACKKVQGMMSASQVDQLRNLLFVILGGIDTGNLELAKQALNRALECLASSSSRIDSKASESKAIPHW